MNKKDIFLDHLKNDIYCRIGVSSIQGVGVIAIKDIPYGIMPFKSLNPNKNDIVSVSINELKTKGVHENVIKIACDFFGGTGKNTCDMYHYGPNDMNISYYLNHSIDNNLDVIVTSDIYYGFITNRDIKMGEELFINYQHYN